MVKFGVVGCNVDPKGALNNDEFSLTGTGLLSIVDGTTVVTARGTNLVVGSGNEGTTEAGITEDWVYETSS